MRSGYGVEVDFIEELKLRRWARENYVPIHERDQSWHPIILHEMGQKEKESLHQNVLVSPNHLNGHESVKVSFVSH